MAGDDEILRIAAQFDVGTITAGMDEAATSVQAGTAKMNDSFSNLANAQIRVASANKELRETLNATVSGGLSPTVSATEEVAAAMYEATAAQEAFKRAQQETFGPTSAASADRLTNSISQLSGRIVGAEAGMGMLGGGIARVGVAAGLAGPLIAAAIPIALVAEAIKLYDDYRESVIKLTEAQTASAHVLDEGNDKLLTQKEHLAELTSGPMAKYAMQLHDIRETLPSLSSGLSAFNKELEDNDHWWLVVGRDADYAWEALKGAVTGGGVGALVAGQLATAKVFDPKDVELFTEQVEKSIHGNQDLAAAIAKVKDELNAVNKLEQAPDATRSEQITNQNSVHAIEEYYDRLLQRQKDYQNQSKIIQAEQHKEGELEAEKELARNLELFRALERIDGMQQRLALDKKRLGDEEEIFGTKGGDAGAAQQIRAIEELGEAEQRFRNESMQLAREAADFDIDEKIRQVNQERALGEISITDAANQIKQLTTQRLQADEQMLDQELTLIQSHLEIARATNAKAYAQDLAAYSALLKQKQQLQQKAATEIEKIDDQTDLKMLSSFEKAIDQITSAFNHGIISWMNGGESFGQAMGKVWINLADTAVESLLKIGEQQLIGLAIGRAIGNQQQLQDAKLAAANTYAAVSAVPVIGPVLAPEAAAVAFAAVLAFEKGGIMPNSEGLALLHPREMVLPSNISESVQRMASGGGAASAGRGFGPMHVHVNVSGSPSASDLKSIEGHIVSSVKRARRRGSF